MRDDPDMSFRMLYFGAAGVIWALDYLSRIGAATIENELFALHGSLRADESPGPESLPTGHFLLFDGRCRDSHGSMATRAYRRAGG